MEDRRLDPNNIYPCPFCGSNLTRPAKVGHTLYAVRCGLCGGEGPPMETMGEAASEWNVRDHLAVKEFLASRTKEPPHAERA